MTETSLVPIALFENMSLKDWPAGSLVAQPGTGALGIVGRFLNEAGVALDRPGILCLTDWPSKSFRAGDVQIEHDSFDVWGIQSNNLKLSVEVDFSCVAPPVDLGVTDLGPMIVLNKSGWKIAGFEHREDPRYRRFRGIDASGISSSVIDPELLISQWALCVEFQDGRSIRLRFGRG